MSIAMYPYPPTVPICQEHACLSCQNSQPNPAIHNDEEIRTPDTIINVDQDCVKWLLKQGVNPRRKDGFGGTPLDDAVREVHQEVAEYLRATVAREEDMVRF